MLGSPNHALIGCHDLDTATAFLSEVGFTEVRDEVLNIGDPNGLYGLGVTITQRWLAVPNWSHGGIRLVETSNSNMRQATGEHGPFAFDVYTTDIEKSEERLTASGYKCGRIARLDFGAPFAQMKVEGPDGLRVVVVQSPRRRSVLDIDPSRLHSEIQSFVFVVSDTTLDDEFWSIGGLEPLMSTTVPMSPDLLDLLSLPTDVETMGMTLFWNPMNPDGTARIEMLSFPVPQTTSQQPRPSASLTTGLNAVCFEVADIEGESERLKSSKPLHLTDALGRPVSMSAGVSPAGVRFELWSRSANE